jgi:hypothetical protein
MYSYFIDMDLKQNACSDMKLSYHMLNDLKKLFTNSGEIRFWHAYVGYMWLCYDDEQWVRAMKECLEYKDLPPQLKCYACIFLSRYERKRNLETAQKWIETALKIMPDNTMALNEASILSAISKKEILGYNTDLSKKRDYTDFHNPVMHNYIREVFIGLSPEQMQKDFGEEFPEQ